MEDDVIFANAVAFHAQQAVEKCLKAFLTSRQVHFPKTHDLGSLQELVETVDNNLAGSLDNVEALTPFGVETRYPADRPDATPDEAKRFAAIARSVSERVSASLPASFTG